MLGKFLGRVGLAAIKICAHFCRHTPQGLRTFKDENWASLRMAVTASAIASTYASIAHVDVETAMHARCLARSQLRYVAGDTGRSYVVGFGEKYPTQVHHRDACCTLEEDKEGLCSGGGSVSAAVTPFCGKKPTLLQGCVHHLSCESAHQSPVHTT